MHTRLVIYKSINQF